MSKYQYPPLKDEKEFESLVNDLCKKEYNNSNFQLYGRKGQKQYGIDGVALNEDKKLIVHQCKNKLISNNDIAVKKDLLKEIEGEVKAFNDEFILEKNLKCDTFIFATSWKQDTELQDKSIELTKKYDFDVIVWSWNEIEDRLERYQEIAKQYYPELYDKSLLSIDDIKGKFIQNSLTLLSARNLFIQNSFIDVKELDDLYNFTISENTEENLLILTGKAGIGKTAILSELQNKLKNENLTYLSIKSDRINVKTKEELGKYFELENLMNSIKKIARDEIVTIIIDQLDALSLTQSSSKDVFNVILEFIQQLKGEFNIKIIISVREYDLKNDPLLKQIDNNKKIYLQLFSDKFVREKLGTMIPRNTKISKALIELLRTPLNLSLFLELYPNDNSCLSIKTLQDLYDEFWKQKILYEISNRELRKNTIILINSIVETMNMDKKIEVAKIYFSDEYSEEINLLLSKNILIEDKNRLSFFHQTFYDYLFAKNFIKNEKSLSDYILSDNQRLEIREPIKQILEFLRGTNNEEYLSQLKQILYSDEVRFHIKLLSISHFGNIDNPNNEEFNFLNELFAVDEKYLIYFMESWISSDWLIHFKKDNFFIKGNIEKYNLASKLEWFVNKDSELVLEILDELEDFSEKEISIMSALNRLEKWDEKAYNLFFKYKDGFYNEEKLNYLKKEILKKLYTYNPNKGIEIFFNLFQEEIKNIENFDKNNFIKDELLDFLKEIIQNNKKEVLYKSLKVIEVIVKENTNKYNQKNYLIEDEVFGSSMWQSEFDLYSSHTFYKIILDEIKKISLGDRVLYLELIDPYKKTRYIALLNFLILGYFEDVENYKDEIYELLTNKNLLEEISTDYDNGYKLLKLLKKSFSFFQEKQKKKIFETLINVSPKLEQKAFIGQWKRREFKCQRNYRGEQQYKLLIQISIEEIKKNKYYKEFQELQRKFNWYKEESPNKFTCEVVGTPLPLEIYSKMNLDNWLKSMEIYGGLNKRQKSFMRGGVLQHSRKFEEEVKLNPKKYYEFLLRIKDYPGIKIDYLSAGLDGLIQSNYNSVKIIEVVNLYSNIDNLKIQNSVLRGIEKIIKDKIYDESFIGILEKYKNLKHDGLIVEDKAHSINNHMNRAINSIEGRLAEILPMIYSHVDINEFNRQKILVLINEIIKRSESFVIFGLLRTLGHITIVDKRLFKDLLCKIVDNDTIGQISIYSLKNIHYLYLQKLIDTEYVLKIGKKSINYIKNSSEKIDENYKSSLGSYLCFYSLENNKNEEFRKILNKGANESSNVIKGLLEQVLRKEIKSIDAKVVEKSKEYILKYKNDESQNWIYGFLLIEMNNLNFIKDDLEFLKELSTSINIQKNPKIFIEYLKNEYYKDFKLGNKIFEILNDFIINTNRNVRNYHQGQTIEFIFELYSRSKLEDQNKFLDLIDKFLINDGYRNSVQGLIE